MGQKVHPYGFRLGIHEDWKSHWFAKKDYGKEFLEDVRIRKFLGKHLGTSEVSKIVVDKAGENIRVIVHSSRPGLVIGKKGQKLKEIGNRGFVSEEGMEKSAIMGALSLYLDFINLFLFLLRIFGDRR